MRKYYQQEDCCDEQVLGWNKRWPTYQQCSRKWKVEENDKRYCTQHSSSKVNERKELAEAKYQEDSKYFHRRSQERFACTDVPTNYLKPGILRKLIDFVYEMDNAELIDELEQSVIVEKE